MSAIRIIKGEYRNKPVRNIAFTLVSGYASGAKGNYVTVKNEGNFPNTSSASMLSSPTGPSVRSTCTPSLYTGV